MFFRAMPAPLATECSGSSAMWNGEPDAVLHDVGIQLRGGVLQGRQHGILYLGHGLVDAVGYLLIAHRHLHGQGGDTVRAVYHIVFRSLVAQVGECRPDGYLDALGHTLRHLDVVLARHVLLDVGRQVVAGRADGVVGHDTAQRDNGNLGAAAADIDNHVPLRGLYVDAHADGGCHRFENQVNITAVGMLGRVAHGTQLHFRRATGHADDHAQRGREEPRPRVNHLDKSAHHLLASREVGYHTVAQRAHGTYVVVCLLIHHLGLRTHGNHLVGMPVESYYRRLVNHNLVITDNNGVGRSQVHGYFLDETEKSHIFK